MARIAVIADIHMRADHADAIERELRWVVEHLETSVDPDRIFVLGDLIQHDTNARIDREHVALVHDCLSAADVPVTYLLGNHDVENLTRDDYRTLLDQETFWGTCWIDETPIVYLDTSWASVPGARGILGGPQLEWLGGVLPDVPNCLVLAHHPIGLFDLSTNHWFRPFPERAFPGDRLEFLGLVRDVGDVRATITGHIHETQFVRFWDAPHVSINAFSKETPDIPLTGTYGVVEIGETISMQINEREVEQAAFDIE